MKEKWNSVLGRIRGIASNDQFGGIILFGVVLFILSTVGVVEYL
jgi:hypothetical protein